MLDNNIRIFTLGLFERLRFEVDAFNPRIALTDLVLNSIDSQFHAFPLSF